VPAPAARSIVREVRDVETTAAAIREIVQAGHGDADLRGLLAGVCDTVSRAFGFDRVAVAEYHAAAHEVTLLALVGATAEHVPARIALAQVPLLERSIGTKQLVQTASAGDEQALPPDLVQACGLTSVFCIPLFSSERCLGFLVGDRGGERFTLDEEDAAALELVALTTAALVDRVLVGEEMQRLDSMKSEFIAIASHELRTPLASVFGISVTLDERGDELTDAERHQLRRALREQAQRIRNLVDQLLDLSRFDVTAVELSPKPIELRQKLEQLVSLVAADAEIELEVPSTLSACVDPLALDRIVSNLLSNSLRYGGAPITIGAVGDESRLRITVEDRGPGVPDEFVPRLFERFSRSERSADSVPGSGLGLAIARAYARSHGGDLTYEHARPHGACFTLALPTTATTQALGPERPPAARVARPPSVSAPQRAPVVVTVTPPAAARTMRELLDDYHAVLVGPDRVTLEPIDDVRRGTVVYRVVQAAHTIAEQFPDADIFFVAEDGNRWRLPPPPI
jgi:signal transduction histidine kinase